jgi:hypothetical protein
MEAAGIKMHKELKVNNKIISFNIELICSNAKFGIDY